MVATRVITASKFNKKVAKWARSMRAVLSPFPAMAVAPTVSVATSSTINSNTGGACSHRWDRSEINYGVDVATFYDANNAQMSQAITALDASTRAVSLQRMRFITDAPEIEFVASYNQFGILGMIADGEVSSFDKQFQLPTIAGANYIKYSFGANAPKYEIIFAQTPLSGGTGYALGDEITLPADGNSDPCILTVASVSGGVVTSTAVKKPGTYSTARTGTLSQASTTGAGTGFTISSYYQGTKSTTKKFRSIEFLITKAMRWRGINVDAKSIVLPWAVPANLPRILFVGDSQTEGTYLKSAAGHMATRIAQRLGLAASYSIQGQGGTGWNTDNGQSARWSSAARIADIVAFNPDIVVFIGSQNDVANSATQSAVTATLNTLLTQLPDALFVGIGSVLCTGSTFIKAGWAAASDQSRCTYIDNVTVPWLTGTGKVGGETNDGNKDFYVSGDAAHLDADGLNFFCRYGRTGNP